MHVHVLQSEFRLGLLSSFFLLSDLFSFHFISVQFILVTGGETPTSVLSRTILSLVSFTETDLSLILVRDYLL